MSNQHKSRMLDSAQAEMALRLWRTKEFDTCEIAKLVGAEEDAVCRLIQASRDMMRLMRLVGVAGS